MLDVNVPLQSVVSLVSGCVLIVVPVILISGSLKKLLAEEKKGRRSPFSEKLIRPAGESLRIKIDEIKSEFQDKFLDLILLILGPAVLMIFSAWIDYWLSLPVALIGAVICYSLAFRKWKEIAELRSKLSNYRLGFHAERIVGSELNRLVAQGYHVFHDLVVDTRPGGEATNYNIDHVAVGPDGVFVFETKGKSKVAPVAGSKLSAHELYFDGKNILFPDGFRSSREIKQAKDNAQYFSDLLSSVVVGELPCRGILVYPGWYVKTDDGGSGGVQTSKGLAKRVPSLGRGRKLSDHEVSALASIIERDCRNVEEE